MRPRCRKVVCLVGVLAFAGCTSWRVRGLEDGPVPPTVRVTLQDWSTVTLRRTRLLGDTLLVGSTDCVDPLSIPVRDIRSVQTRRFDVAKTLTFVGTGAVGILLGVPLLVVLLPGGYT